SHLDGTHYHMRTLGGLHPAYIAFSKIPLSMERQSLTQGEFVEAALEDVFDALATQDHLDGRLSLLIRCPGSHFTDAMTPDSIAVDLCVTPRELHEAPEQIGGDEARALLTPQHHQKSKVFKDAINEAWLHIDKHIILICALEEITRVPKAMMQWVNYWCNIVQCYCVICEGWPGHIPFKNLSEASSSL
ncbi:hypothetical protein EDB19DRAFT_1593925, partial [Suillus lakei]